MLSETLEFNIVDNIYEVLNNTLSQAEHFVKVPPVRTANAIIYHKPGDFVQYKMRPETDCEELIYVFNQNKSMIEVLELHDNPFWKERDAYLQDMVQVTILDMWAQGPAARMEFEESS